MTKGTKRYTQSGAGDLTAKKRRFVDEYFRTRFNGTQAAKNAGYSPKWARQAAYELLKEDEAVKAEVERRLELSVMAGDEALAIINDIAQGSIEDCIDVHDDGTWSVNLKKAEGNGKLHLIQEVGYDRQGRPRVKMYSRHEAARDIAKARGKFVEKHEHSGSVDLPGLTVVVKRGPES